MRALRKNPADRFQRIEELQALLVDELRAAGASSVETLLDSGRLRRLARADRPERRRARGALATRDEVDAYERHLRRTRYGAVGAAGGRPRRRRASGRGAARRPATRDARRGVEIEPNDTAGRGDAHPVRPADDRARSASASTRPTATATSTRSTCPPRGAGARRVLRLRLTALPNIAVCTMLYRAGFADPVGQYCVGPPRPRSRHPRARARARAATSSPSSRTWTRTAARRPTSTRTSPTRTRCWWRARRPERGDHLSTKLLSAATTTPTMLSPAMRPDAIGTTSAAARCPSCATRSPPRDGAPRNIESGW